MICKNYMVSLVKLYEIGITINRIIAGIKSEMIISQTIVRVELVNGFVSNKKNSSTIFFCMQIDLNSNS